MLEIQLLCNHLRPSKIMKFKLIAMLLLLEIIGEYSKMKVRAHLEDHYPFNICLFFLIVSFHINLILYKCQSCLHKTGGNTFNI